MATLGGCSHLSHTKSALFVDALNILSFKTLATAVSGELMFEILFMQNQWWIFGGSFNIHHSCQVWLKLVAGFSCSWANYEVKGWQIIDANWWHFISSISCNIQFRWANAVQRVCWKILCEHQAKYFAQLIFTRTEQTILVTDTTIHIIWASPWYFGDHNNTFSQQILTAPCICSNIFSRSIILFWTSSVHGFLK